jgi:RNA polymerase sigma-70 factor (sigma-E family)
LGRLRGVGGVRGCQVTFEEFVELRLDALLRQATALAGDPGLAEDVVQDVLVKAHLRWSSIGGLDRPEAYVRKMIINELSSTRRRLKARLRREHAHPPEPVGDRADQIAQHEALVQLIRTLPARQRIVIVLRYFEDMADADIAGLLGCRLATVRSHAARGLAALRAVAAPELAREER